MDHLHQGHLMRPSSSSGHEAALRSVQKPPAKPWRGAGVGTSAPAPTPPKVYRVEPREFRDLVQRLTGAAPAAAPAPAKQHHHHHVTQPVAVRAGVAQDAATARNMYAPWSSFPLMEPAAAVHPAGLDGHHLI